MSVSLLFEQLASLRSSGITYPVLLMGYLNPLEQFGRARFFERAEGCGVDGLIIPDLPFEEYLSDYKTLFVKHRLRPVFLVTPRTPAERIRAFDNEAPAFLYVLSSDAVTGGRAAVSDERQAFFSTLRGMGLKSHLIVGFGVADRESFNTVTTHTDGAIVGSAFVRALRSARGEDLLSATPQSELNHVISNFIKGMR
jgi:tryptophan synthase alpha chain